MLNCKKNYPLFFTFLWLLFFGCNEDSHVSSINESIPIFNQAYQENYEADTISEILEDAKDAYVLVDPFVNGVVSKISLIKSKGNQLGGYISVGTGENYRDDFTELEPYLSSRAWEEWSDEFYVSKITPQLVSVMKYRIDKMAEWGIDWVEFDNMDWLNKESKKEYGLDATLKEAKNYINELCNYTHQKGMKCMAKNSLKGFENFDGILYESYHQEKNWWDKEDTKIFLAKKKLVIINHYNESNCDAIYEDYKGFYKNNNISFICEDKKLKKYKHYNLKY